MVLVEVNRKSRVLTKAQFGCLKDVYTLNVTRGCEFNCVYCYARGYPGAPPLGEVHLYGNLPEKLEAELDRQRRRSGLSWVAFNTASDSFQTHPGVLDITYRTMEILLERGIGISFLTKGWIPDRFIQLFSRYPGLVASRIGLVSLSPTYRDLFEPFAATVPERLKNIDRLKGEKIDTEVRIDPIIPFYTDDEGTIKRLFEALAARGVRKVSLSYIHLRPAISDQLRRELPATEWNVLRSCFKNQPWSVVGDSTRTRLIPLPLRKKGYGRFMALSKEFGMTCLICSCKNPDMPSHRCSTGIFDKEMRIEQRQKENQLSLFSC
jgi:DNA repair photolyase